MSKNIFFRVFLIVLGLLFIQTVNAAINLTIVSPSTGWNSNYNVVFNVTTNGYTNVTFNTSSYSTLTTLFTNDTQGNITLNSSYLSEGNNTIYIFAVNYSDSSDLNDSNVDNVAVDLSAPAWDEVLTNQTLEYGDDFLYDVNATDAGIGIDIYFINDSTNFAINSTTGLITNNTNLSLGTYALNVSVNDSYNHINSSIINIIVQDTTAPIWDTALANQSVTYGNSFSYDVDASDTLAIDSYFINDTTNFAVNATNGIITNHTTLSVGTYWLNLSVNDTSNNIRSQLITITVGQVAATPSSGGGSSRHEDIVVVPDETKEIDLEFSNDIISTELTTNDIGKFTLNGNHEISISKIKDDLAIIIVKSKTQSFILSEGQSKKLDIDSNIFNYDLEVALESISEDSVSVILKKINEPIRLTTIEEMQVQKIDKTVEKENINKEDADNSITGDIILETEKTSNIITSLIVIGLISGIAIFFLMKKK